MVLSTWYGISVNQVIIYAIIKALRNTSIFLVLNFFGGNSCNPLSLCFLTTQMKAGTRYTISPHDRSVSETAEPWMEDLIFGRSLTQPPPLYLSNYFTPESDPVFEMGVMQWSTEAQMALIYFETFTANTSPLELFYIRKSVSDQGPIVLGAVPKKRTKMTPTPKNKRKKEDWGDVIMLVDFNRQLGISTSIRRL